jgi:hypothetical protein
MVIDKERIKHRSILPAKYRSFSRAVNVLVSSAASSYELKKRQLYRIGNGMGNHILTN